MLCVLGVGAVGECAFLSPSLFFSLSLFHSSAGGSILRTGLQNLSNGVFMSAGAARGPGIYTATDVGTSWGYSARGAVGYAVAGEKYRAIAVCALQTGTGGMQAFGNIYTIQDARKVEIQFLWLVPY